MLHVVYTVGVRTFTVETPPPYTTTGADAARVVNGWCANLYCATPPNTTVRADAARFFHG